MFSVSSIGTPLRTNSVTSKENFERSFGYFVRVLVDMKLAKMLRYKVLVERQGYAFFRVLDKDISWKLVPEKEN